MAPTPMAMGTDDNRGNGSATAREARDDVIAPVHDSQAVSRMGTRRPENQEEASAVEISSGRQNSRQPSRWRGYFAKSGKLRPFRLLREDFLNFRLRYVSDWAVFNQLVLASAVYVFFTNILPGITFASDLYVLTGESWGTIEVVFSTGLCGIIFALFSAQPLTILGVTGPFSVLAENIYSLSIFNAHDYTMQYVTDFSADIFSLLNSVIYFYKAVRELQRTKAVVSLAAFLYSIIGAAGTCLLAIFLSTAMSWKPLFHRYIRMGLTEYAAAISIVFFIGMPYVGDLAHLDHNRLMVQKTFKPSSPDRNYFFVEFWKLPIGWIFIAIIPGIIITVLFYFDHEISSIICTAKRYGIQKPGGYAWDVMLLGTTTIMCGILGIPPANGLLPQAPLHSESLMYTVVEDPPAPDSEPGETHPVKPVTRVHEQRYSHFIQAAGIFIFVSPPFQHVLGLTPTSVLAGLFMFMGYQSLSVNPILTRIWHLLTPISELPALPHGASWGGIHLYTISQLILTGIVFGVTLTVAAPGFPIIIIILVPVRLFLMNKIWSRETLRLKHVTRRVKISILAPWIMMPIRGPTCIFEPAWSSFWNAPKTPSNPQSESRDVADAEPGTYAVIDVNLTHPIRLSQLAIGYWTQEHRPGCLVHVSSIAGHAYGIGTPLYFASKHGLHGFVRSLGDMRDLLGIRCSAVAPGAVMTPMWHEDPGKKDMASGEESESLFIEPEEIARAMLELCENPEYGNGTILEVAKGAKRVVPLYYAEPPKGDGVALPKFSEASRKVLVDVKAGGLRV
nr:hco3-transporter family protein [Colletotrichum truncatum]KAF6800629.1 hco3-transporter family protein [Colletotrichum truncatum]